MSKPRLGIQHVGDLIVLSLIGGGMILVIILIVVGLFGWFESKTTAPLPNWAENVLVSLVSVLGLKLGDVLNALITLATGRQVETMSRQLGESAPLPRRDPPPKDAAEGAELAADAAGDVADELGEQAGERA